MSRVLVALIVGTALGAAVFLFLCREPSGAPHAGARTGAIHFGFSA